MLLLVPTAAVLVAGCGGGAAPETEAALTGQEAQFVAMLGSIAPYTAEDPERSVGRGENVCADLAAGEEVDAVVARTQERFTGGSGSVDEAQARQIVEAAQSTIC